MWNPSTDPRSDAANAAMARPTAARVPAERLAVSPRYQGPERRARSGLPGLMAALLDEIDHGLLLVRPCGQVLHANHPARLTLQGEHPLQLLGGRLRALRPQDVGPLHQALGTAAQQGRRQLLMLGTAPHRVGVSVLPGPAVVDGPTTTEGGQGAALVMLGRLALGHPLQVTAYAQLHRLSYHEARVLAGLCEGLDPTEIAKRHAVKIATVRTQIAQIRAKTQTDSIRSLVQEVARLPPVTGALRSPLA